MQRAVCLAKFKWYSHVYEKQRYESVHLCHCASQWNLRDIFINWNCIMLLSIIWISEIQVHKLYF